MTTSDRGPTGDDTKRLYEECHGILIRLFVREFAGQRVEEDMVNDVFLRYLKARRSDPVTPGAYIHTIASNLVIERKTRVAAKRSGEQISLDDFETSPESAHSVLDELHDAIDLQRLREAIGALPEPERTALEARLRGETHEDIAQLSGSDGKTVANLIRRATRSLKRKFRLSQSRSDEP
ncbi:MAG: sigma-70 family RNA polymerase sigma factor [Gammaproteobacteria bacterium]